MAESVPALKVEDIHKSFGNIKVLKGISLEAFDHDVISILGSSGYGKSTLVSSWLATIEKPSAWLSLDEDDNDLQRFLSYFIAAIQTVAPSTMSETQSLIDASILPPPGMACMALIKIFKKD